MFSKVASSIEPSVTLAISAKAKAMKAKGEDVIGFGAGEPDFDTPVSIKEKAKEAIDKGLTKYTPASGMLKLKEVVAKKFKEDNNLEYDIDNIIVSNGAKQSILNLIMTIVNKGDEVIVPAPFWVSYPEMVKLAEGKPVIVHAKEENGFKITADQIRNYISANTKAIILCNPSNPTGAVYSGEELEALAEIIET